MDPNTTMSLPRTHRPRIIIHGGAGAITRDNLPPASWRAHRHSLLHILHTTHALLTSSKHPASALAAATAAVAMFEDDAQFNCARGAVFTRAGTIECEASVMVASVHGAAAGFRKRGAGVMLVKHVRNPVLLAAEMLRRGEEDGGGGGQGHVQLSGAEVEALAEEWGLKMCDEKYYWTRKRWEDHKRGLDKGWACEGVEWPPGEPGWDGKEYLPQGTVGCVVLDAYGSVCAATSTGGMNNKLPGRIGDTPTFGAGFWAEQWVERIRAEEQGRWASLDPWALMRDCLGLPAGYEAVREKDDRNSKKGKELRHVVGMSGTGNGDSFLQVNAVRTAAAMSRFLTPCLPLAEAVTAVAGAGGELQQSAGDRWGKAFEGEGGIIGIEAVDGTSKIVADFNCGGMFRAWIDDDGCARCMVFKEEY